MQVEKMLWLILASYALPQSVLATELIAPPASVEPEATTAQLPPVQYPFEQTPEIIPERPSEPPPTPELLQTIEFSNSLEFSQSIQTPSPTLPTQPNPEPLPSPIAPPPAQLETPSATQPDGITPCAPIGSDQTPTEPTIQIRDIEINGNQTVLKAEIDKVKQTCLAQFRQPIAEAQILIKGRQVADAITQLYLDAGYLTSRAVYDTTSDGVLKIQIYEGSLQDIQIKWKDQRQHPRLEAYVRQRIMLGAGTPLRLSRLEDQLRLLKIEPLFNEEKGGTVKASLRLSGVPGQSILVVTLEKADPFQAAVGADNYAPPSIGAEEIGGSLGYGNVIGTGDRISLAYNHSLTNGLNAIGINYQVPVNPMNGTIQLEATFNFTRVTDPDFEKLNITGEEQSYEIGFRQPLTRTPREELALGASFRYRNGQNFADQTPQSFSPGVGNDGISRTSVLQFSQEYIRRSPFGAWVLRSQFNLGLDLFDATVNDSPTPSGQFFSWLGQVQRSQIFSRRNILLLQADLQLTPDSLLPSEQFFIGGVQSVRGYRQNVRSGDNGFRISIEDRIALITDAASEPKLQVAPFAELGVVWNHQDNPTPDSGQNLLAGVGLGILWQPLHDLNFRADYGLALVDPEGRSDNLQEHGLYFSINYTF